MIDLISGLKLTCNEVCKSMHVLGTRLQPVLYLPFLSLLQKSIQSVATLHCHMGFRSRKTGRAKLNKGMSNDRRYSATTGSFHTASLVPVCMAACIVYLYA